MEIIAPCVMSEKFASALLLIIDSRLFARLFSIKQRIFFHRSHSRVYTSIIIFSDWKISREEKPGQSLSLYCIKTYVYENGREARAPISRRSASFSAFPIFFSTIDANRLYIAGARARKRDSIAKNRRCGRRTRERGKIRAGWRVWKIVVGI